MRSRLSLPLLIALTTAVLTGQGQDVRRDATFRTSANYVRVDMYATQNGQVIEDLRPEEVELLEDGVPQAIETFEQVQVRPAGPQETRIEPNSLAASRQMATGARSRVFVVFLDTYHTQIEGSANMRLPLVRFLDRVMGQDDLVALMTPEMGATDITFGRKTTVISNIMQEEWAWARKGRTAIDDDPREALYLTCFPDVGDTRGIAAEMKDRRREQMTLDALDDLVVYLRGVREERKAVITVSEGWRLYSENQRLASVTQQGGVPFGPRVGVDPRGRVTTGQTNAAGLDRSVCDADRLALALMNNSRRVRDLMDAANRANVSFYPVYPRGLAVFDAPIDRPDRPDSLASDRATLAARQNTLRELAENTDGLAVVDTNDIEGALRRIAADLSSYYLLGYYSSNTKLDGRFRTIRVRVKRPGVQVRARRGYRGLTAEELVAANGPDAGSRAGAAAPAGVVVNPRAPFRIRTAGWTSTTAEGPRGAVWVVGELDAATRKELAWSAGATAEVAVVAADGAEVVSTTIDLPATDGAFAFRVPPDGGMAPGEYAVRVRVRPSADPGLPVSDTVRLIVSDVASALGEPVMWRRGPSTGPRHLVTADPRFQRNERIRFELATAAVGAAAARMLDRAGNPMQVPVQVSERPDPSGAFRWIVADTALAPLAAGDYAIEVTLGDSRQVGAFKVVP
ncbi:MAG: VWA domain-containing protein [Acidobacteria bacterium]|nr:VWA domain-containing protein [Acidobacteriota bacterium]